MQEQLGSPALEMLVNQDVAFLEQATAEGFLTVEQATRCREIQREILNSSSRFERASRIALTEGYLTVEEVKAIERRLVTAQLENESESVAVAAEAEEEVLDKPEDLDLMIIVEEGPFVARSYTEATGEREETIHLKRYAIDKYEVTNKEFEIFLRETGGLIPQHWTSGRIPPGKEYHPVTGVSWHDALRYAQWCGKRLPTKWEWEKAAGGPEGMLYAWGNTFRVEACHSLLSAERSTVPVHACKEGMSPYGILNMCGNVWEWTNDSVTRVEEEAVESFRIIKGGSFYCGPLGLRVSAFSKAYDRMKDADLGFRCVMEVTAEMDAAILVPQPVVTERPVEEARLPVGGIHIPQPAPAAGISETRPTMVATSVLPSLDQPTSGSSRRTVVASETGDLAGLGTGGSDVHSSPTVAMGPTGSDSITKEGDSVSSMETIALSPDQSDADLVRTREAMGIFDGVSGAEQTPAPEGAPPTEAPAPGDDVFGAETMAISGSEAQAGMQGLGGAVQQEEIVDLQMGAETGAMPQPGVPPTEAPAPGADVFGAETMAISGSEAQAGMQGYGEGGEQEEIVDLQMGSADAAQYQAPQEAYPPEQGYQEQYPQEGYDQAYVQPGYEQQPQAGYEGSEEYQQPQDATGQDVFGAETMAIPPREGEPGQTPMDDWDRPLTDHDTQEMPQVPEGEANLYGTPLSEGETQEMPKADEVQQMPGFDAGAQDIYGSETMAIPPRPEDDESAIDLQPKDPDGGYPAQEPPGGDVQEDNPPG